MTPIKIAPTFEFYALAGVEDVHIEDESVIGRWKTPLTRISEPAHEMILTRFVNESSSPGRIKLFIEKYGPLKETPLAGRGFKFPLRVWHNYQKTFRELWRTRKRMTGDLEFSEKPGALRLTEGKLVYQAKSLEEFMVLELMGCAAERMKICADPDCVTQYFFARHLKQKYCSDLCANRAQRKWKSEWWQSHGNRWRNDRRKGKKQRKSRYKRS